MRLSPDRLKNAYREYLRGLTPPTRRSCPPTDDLMRFFASGPSRRFKSRILDHVASCGPCAEEFEILAGMDRAARMFAESVARLPPGSPHGSGSRKSTRGFWGPGRIAAAGAGLAALGAGILIMTGGPTAPPLEEPVIYRSAEERIPVGLDTPVGPVGHNAVVVFRWHSADRRIEGPRVVSLFDDSLARIWKSPPVDSGYVFLPQAVQASLISGRRYFWGISLLSEDSAEDSDLETFWIETGR